MDVSTILVAVFGPGSLAALFWGMIKYQSNADKVERLKEDVNHLEKEMSELKQENRDLQRKVEEKNEIILNHLK